MDPNNNLLDHKNKPLPKQPDTAGKFFGQRGVSMAGAIIQPPAGIAKEEGVVKYNQGGYVDAANLAGYVDPQLPSDEMRGIAAAAHEIKCVNRGINLLRTARMMAICNFYQNLGLKFTREHCVKVYDLMDTPRGYHVMHNPKDFPLQCVSCGELPIAVCNRCQKRWICSSDCALKKCKSGSCTKTKKKPAKCANCGLEAHLWCQVCLVATYYSPTCQHQHWCPAHKKVCTLHPLLMQQE